jgi:hypothetical protein
MLLSAADFTDADGWVVCAVFNYSYRSFMRNFLRAMRRARVPWTLCLLCQDREAFKYCCRKGLPCLPFITGTSAGFEAKGTNAYASLTFPHFDALAWLLRQPSVRRVAYLHLDSYLLADFLPSLKTACAEDKDLFALSSGAPGKLSTGLIVLRSSEAVHELLLQPRICTPDVMTTFVDPEDWFNSYLSEAPSLSIAALPENTFLNVPSQFVASPEGVLFIHYGNTVGSETKRAVMSAFGHWHLSAAEEADESPSP